jgi:hypothetical protein
MFPWLTEVQVQTQDLSPHERVNNIRLKVNQKNSNLTIEASVCSPHKEENNLLTKLCSSLLSLLTSTSCLKTDYPF